jgi:hypothetical protein
LDERTQASEFAGCFLRVRLRSILVGAQMERRMEPTFVGLCFWGTGNRDRIRRHSVRKGGKLTLPHRTTPATEYSRTTLGQRSGSKAPLNISESKLPSTAQHAAEVTHESIANNIGAAAKVQQCWGPYTLGVLWVIRVHYTDPDGQRKASIRFGTLLFTHQRD